MSGSHSWVPINASVMDTFHQYAKQAVAEFVGTALFGFLGSTACSSPLGNGLALAACTFMTRGISGGHLNPSVSLAAALTNKMSWSLACIYATMQVAGAVAGSLLVALATPGVRIGAGPDHAGLAAGCYVPAHEASMINVLASEWILTGVLVTTWYAVHLGRPGFFEVGPLAVGLALSAAMQGATTTGGAANPARLIAPALVFMCPGRKFLWAYIAGQLAASVCVAVGAWWWHEAPWSDSARDTFVSDTDRSFDAVTVRRQMQQRERDAAGAGVTEPLLTSAGPGINPA
ncbi:unnamed protein product [Pedinophyceae sp. YPF-701]|nr:unnamed protein product [Pedinophyceae sp. YPF-701]